MSQTAIGHVGALDRVARFVIGALLIAMAVFCPWAASFGPAMTWGAGAVGLILVVTAAYRFCPLYRVLGLCT